MEKATFAAGCFWGVQHILKNQNGVQETRSGYIGGVTGNPNYKDVCTGETGHAEAVEVIFDPSVIDFETLLDLFFRLHDPTQLNRQGVDIGTQYRSAVFYHSDNQKEQAERMIEKLDSQGKFEHKIVTQVAPATDFFAAEDYHQDYFDKNPGPVCHLVREW